MKKYKFTGFFTLLILLALPPIPAAGAAGPALKADVAQALRSFRVFFHSRLEKHGIVGGSAAFIRDNRVLDLTCCGLADKDSGVPIDKDTIYHWASITKTMGGIAVMQLRDRGLLRLDDPVLRYLPELARVHNPFGDMSGITIRHLMTHSAGFRAPTWPWKNKPWHPHEPLEWAQLVAMLPYTEILFEPGSKFSMSNPGITFMGIIVERITTDDWETYIEKNIFKPLEMRRSYFDVSPYHLKKHKALSYYRMDGKLIPADPDVNTGITVSNGGLKAPVGDMIRYINFLMGDPDHPERQAAYDSVLKRATLEEMFQPQLPITDLELEYPGENRKDAIGLTFYLEDNFGFHFVAHRGHQNAFTSHFYLNPRTRAAYITAFNTTAMDGEKNTAALDIEVKEYLFQHVFPLFLDH
jgi:CubicO group peptidase (beta-lactamase class C family)